MKFLIPLFPARQRGKNKCESTIGINPAGKPIKCRNPGYVQIQNSNGPVLCRSCFRLAKPKLEQAAAHPEELSPEGRQDRRKESRKKRGAK